MHRYYYISIAMRSFALYQCIPAYKPGPTIRLIKSALSTNCKILLDIEDSIQDIEHMAYTPQLKAQARMDLMEIFHSLPGHKFSLRVNSTMGSEFRYDKEILHTAGHMIESVFLPKVESKMQLEMFCHEYGDKFRLNLIVESQAGIDNLESILTSEFVHNVDHVFFGNYDYHLDRKIYPVREQNSLQYWNVVAPLITMIEEYNVSFGNSPYANIGDTDCLAYSLDQLRRLCKRPFTMVSLHKVQTRYIQQCAHQMDSFSPGCDQQEYFSHTLELFQRQRQKGRSFAINNRRIITPQEYLLQKEIGNG